MGRHVFGSGVNFDAGNDSRIGKDFDKGSSALRLLADGLVIENRAADAFAEAGRGHNQFPIGAPCFYGLRNPQPGKSFGAGGIAFIHCKQALIVGDEGFRRIHQPL